MHKIPELDRKGLRDFALITGAIIAILFGLFFPWLLETGDPIWPWIICGILVAAGLFAPMVLQPVYRLWMRFGLLLSKITTPLILGIVFFLVIMPMGLVMRLMGHDPMSRKLDDAAISYRVVSKKNPKENLEKPY